MRFQPFPSTWLGLIASYPADLPSHPLSTLFSPLFSLFALLETKEGGDINPKKKRKSMYFQTGWLCWQHRSLATIKTFALPDRLSSFGLYMQQKESTVPVKMSAWVASLTVQNCSVAQRIIKIKKRITLYSTLLLFHIFLSFHAWFNNPLFAGQTDERKWWVFLLAGFIFLRLHGCDYFFFFGKTLVCFSDAQVRSDSKGFSGAYLCGRGSVGSCAIHWKHILYVKWLQPILSVCAGVCVCLEYMFAGL